MTDQIPEQPAQQTPPSISPSSANNIEITRRQLLEKLGKAALGAGVTVAAGALAGCAPGDEYSSAQAQKIVEAKKTESQTNLEGAKQVAEGIKRDLVLTLFSPDLSPSRDIRILNFDLVADPNGPDPGVTVKGRPIPVRLDEEQISLEIKQGNKMIIPKPIIIEDKRLAVDWGERGYWFVALGSNGEMDFFPITAHNIAYLWADQGGQLTKVSQLGINPQLPLPPDLVQEATMVKGLIYKVGNNPEQKIQYASITNQGAPIETAKGY